MKKFILIIIGLVVIVGAARNNVRIQYQLPEKIKQRITGVSFKEDGPVGLDKLAYMKVRYIDFSGEAQVGEIIVHESIAEEVHTIFNELYQKKFPIEKISLIDEYEADDDLSMEHNNSSAFCVRKKTKNEAKWSVHSFGLAIDINPVQNPYVKKGMILPKKGKDHLNRKDVRKGMIVKDGPCYNAFVKRGWTWGGDWNNPKDYMHFEKT